jgi:hypothetical protein
MKRCVLLLATGALMSMAAAPVWAQSAPTGVGGAKEQMLPSTVGVDPRPDRETFNARRPMMHAIQGGPRYSRTDHPGWRRYSHEERYIRVR